MFEFGLNNRQIRSKNPNFRKPILSTNSELYCYTIKIKEVAIFTGPLYLFLK